jgi:hypothetical protein
MTDEASDETGDELAERRMNQRVRNQLNQKAKSGRKNQPRKPVLYRVTFLKQNRPKYIPPVTEDADGDDMIDTIICGVTNTYQMPRVTVSGTKTWNVPRASRSRPLKSSCGGIS